MQIKYSFLTFPTPFLLYRHKHHNEMLPNIVNLDEIYSLIPIKPQERVILLRNLFINTQCR